MPTRKRTVPEEIDEDPASEEDLETIEELEEEEDLETLDDDDDDLADVLGTGDVLDDDVIETDEVEADADADVIILTPQPAAVVDRPADETDEEDEDEPDDEDVEASLDVILKERLVVEDEVDDEEPADVEDRSEMTERVLPKQPDEFVCRSCFLVKHPSQLANRKKMLCRDCV